MVGVVELDPGAVANAAGEEVPAVGRVSEEDADGTAAGRAVPGPGVRGCRFWSG